MFFYFYFLYLKISIQKSFVQTMKPTMRTITTKLLLPDDAKQPIWGFFCFYIFWGGFLGECVSVCACLCVWNIKLRKNYKNTRQQKQEEEEERLNGSAKSKTTKLNSNNKFVDYAPTHT